MAKRKETTGQLVSRAKVVITLLKKEYPEARTALQHSNPLQLLIATILSAQCTDERVNMVTPELFKRYRTVHDFANANQAELEEAIRSTGFFRNKAKNIIGCCKAIVEVHRGSVPESMEELVQLPGVGRKTANCVLGGAFGRAEGVVVDTHVQRLAGRLGLSRNETPEKIEQDLMKTVPKKDWYLLSNLLILHGRRVCDARKPKCPECMLNELCPSAEKFVQMYWK